MAKLDEIANASPMYLFKNQVSPLLSKTATLGVGYGTHSHGGGPRGVIRTSRLASSLRWIYGRDRNRSV